MCKTDNKFYAVLCFNTSFVVVVAVRVIYIKTEIAICQDKILEKVAQKKTKNELVSTKCRK